MRPCRTTVVSYSWIHLVTNPAKPNKFESKSRGNALVARVRCQTSHSWDLKHHTTQCWWTVYLIQVDGPTSVDIYIQMIASWTSALWTHLFGPWTKCPAACSRCRDPASLGGPCLIKSSNQDILIHTKETEQNLDLGGEISKKGRQAGSVWNHRFVHCHYGWGKRNSIFFNDVFGNSWILKFQFKSWNYLRRPVLPILDTNL